MVLNQISGLVEGQTIDEASVQAYRGARSTTLRWPHQVRFADLGRHKPH